MAIINNELVGKAKDGQAGQIDDTNERSDS